VAFCADAALATQKITITKKIAGAEMKKFVAGLSLAAGLAVTTVPAQADAAIKACGEPPSRGLLSILKQADAG
jgi:hypothetical protein